MIKAVFFDIDGTLVSFKTHGFRILRREQLLFCVPKVFGYSLRVGGNCWLLII